MQLRPLIADPRRFRDALLLDTNDGPRRLGSILDPWQRENFESADPGWMLIAGRHTGPAILRHWTELSRGSAKTTGIAVSVLWALLSSRRAIHGVVCAADKEQAAILKQQAETILRLNPWLAQVIESQRDKLFNRTTGSDCIVISNDVPSSWGLLLDFAVLDEVSVWPKRDLFDSLFSTAAKKPCLLAAITNSGWKDSWCWPLREAIRVDPAWRFVHIDGCQASWILRSGVLDEQKRLLPPSAFARIWGNVWVDGKGDALNPEDIERAITQQGPPRPDEPGWIAAAGLDLGLSRDRSALCVVARHCGWIEHRPAPPKPKSRRAEIFDDLELTDDEIVSSPAIKSDEEVISLAIPPTSRIRLQSIEAWSPPAGGKVDLQRVEAAVLEAWRKHRFQVCSYDPWQAELLASRLRSQGVPMVACEPVASNIRAQARALLEGFSEGSLDLYDDPDLLRDLRAARVEERSYGVRIVSPRDNTGHGDKLSAYVMAVAACRQLLGGGMSREIVGDLIAY